MTKYHAPADVEHRPFKFIQRDVRIMTGRPKFQWRVWPFAAALVILVALCSLYYKFGHLLPASFGGA